MAGSRISLATPGVNLVHKAFVHVLLGDDQELKRVLSFDGENPFGKPGVDYSETYIVQTWPLSSGWSEEEEFIRCNQYALRLCLSLASRFPAVEGFHPFSDLYGKLSQIDNMTCKLPLGFGSSNDTASEHKP